MTLKKFGDPDYGPYGFGFANPAFNDQEPVSNAEYIATIPEDDPWRLPIETGAAILDMIDPHWRVIQIKQKFFGECRFYIEGNPVAQGVARLIEGTAELAELRKE